MRLDHLLSRELSRAPLAHSQVEQDLLYQKTAWAVFHSSVVGVPITCTFTTELYSYFNFAVEQKRSRGTTRTSYTEYEVDASALKAEEGRGDRRNVQGELHTSDEP